MKFKKIIIVSIVLSFFLSNSALAVNWGDWFQTDRGGLSFTEYQGQLTTLSSEGYDPALVASTDLREFVIKIVNYALGFLGLIAVLVIIYGGILYVTSAGNDTNLGTAKNAIKYSLIGLLIVLGSFAFVNTIIKAGGGSDTTGQIRRITAGRTATGFNSSAEELKQLAEQIYNNFSVLSAITLEFKTIQGDASKQALLPTNMPSKAVILNYLTGVRAKITSISTKVPLYSDAYIKLKRLEREVDRQLDLVRRLNETAFIRITNSGESVCDPSKVTDFWDALTGTNPCEDYPIYTRGLYDFWGNPASVNQVDRMDISATEFANKNIQQIWAEGVLFQPIVESVKEEYKNILSEAFYRLQEINIQLQGYYGGVSNNTAEADYNRMRRAYGFSNVIMTNDLKNPFRVTADGRENFYTKIENWTLGSIDSDPIGPANQDLSVALTYHSLLYKTVSELKFVEARLTANVIEGSAPLTVIFDALATNDPAGGTLNKDNILWDLGGSQTISDLMSKGNYGTILPSADMTCDREGIIISDQSLQDQDVKIGSTAQRCTYHKPGTYQAAIKIKSNDAQGRYAPGISILTIKVNPPNTKIDLSMTPSGSDEIVLMRYNNDGTLLSNKNNVSVTLEQARAGISFDASGTYASQYKWDFGNGDVREYTANPRAIVSYSNQGRYSVKLEVMNQLGVVDRKVFTLDISELSARIFDNNRGKGLINTDVIFDGTASRSDRGGIRSYRWTISPSAGQAVPENLQTFTREGATLSKLTYKFEYPLLYDISLTVTDQNNNSSTDTLEGFEVSSQKPIAQFTHKIASSSKPSTVIFNSDLSFDPDGDDKFLSYEWKINETEDKYRFVDGTSASSKNPVIEFTNKGEYRVSLKVTDMLTSGQKEEFGEITKTIKIDSTLDLEWGEFTTFSEMINEDGEAEITFDIISQNAVAYEIEFGDGNSETGAFSQRKQIKHKYTKSGRFQVFVTVYNSEEEDNGLRKTVFIGDGSSPIAKINLFVDDAQVYDFSEPITINKKTRLRFDASESKNTDGTGRKLNYSWDFGDTTRSSSRIASHSYNELSPRDTGFYTVQLTVSDRDSSNIRATDEIRINVENIAPKFSSLQGIPRIERGNNTTPITVLMKVYGAEDPDGSITQYRWWYYNIETPENELGTMITRSDTAQMIIGTNGREGDKITYAFGVELTDNDNLSFSSRELYTNETVPKIEVVNGPNAMPQARFSVNATKVFLGDPVIFTSTSTDSDGEIVSYIWDLEGDGFHNNEPTDKSTIEHFYTEKNLKGYDVRLKVKDDKGGEAVSPIVKIYVDAKSNPPVADFEYSFPDPNNKLKVEFKNTSTVDEEVGARIAQTLWDFDINKDTTGDMIRNNDIDSRNPNPTWVYDSYGIIKVKLQVIDSLGERSEIVKDVVIGDNVNIDQLRDSYDPLSPSTPDQGAEEKPSEEKVEIPLENVKAVLEVRPSVLSGERDIAVLDFSSSTGPIKYFQIDKNIYSQSFNHSEGPDQDIDYITNRAGTWQTTFLREWGEIAVKLTVIREDGQKDSVVKKIIFQ